MMRNLASSIASRRTRTSCSVLALATVFIVGPTPASAQSFLGVGSPTNGAATTITNGVGTTTITVSTPQTVINWVPTDNATNNNVPIQFQNSGTTANFLGVGNYAVLNNIVATDLSRAITLNGTINAGALGAGAAANGSIYFYAPSGIVLGGSSSINVGSLVLSASPIFVNGSGNFINGASNQVIFGQALRPTSAITTNTGSVINAIAGDAYVAMVAPRVQHGGTINVNGSAALVGAEAATINFSPSGLFDIQVTAGTTNANGVVVNGGTITGAASTGAGDIHRAYLVAVPKNNALTMLVSAGSNIGFNVAGAANVVGNTVVLSAGYDVVGGAAGTTRSALGGSGTSTLAVYDSDFTSQVNAAATGLGLFVAFSTTASMSAGLSLRAADAQFNSFDSGVLQVANSVIFDTNNLGAGTGATGGIIFVTATSGGAVNIGGDLILSARGIGSSSGMGTGGSIHISAGTDTGSSVTVTGMVRANADGVGGNGAAGLGGSIDIIAGTGATLSAGSLNASADGFGGDDVGYGAGNGTGGTARLLATGAGASIAIANVVTVGNQNQRDFISVEGYGGQTNGGGSDLGGSGQGGTLWVQGENGGSIALSTNPLSADIRLMARGYGGDASAEGTTGGTGTAGIANVWLNNATLVTGRVQLSAAGLGGNAIGTSFNITGGNGIGGTRSIDVRNGSTLTASFPGGIAGGGGGNGSGSGSGGNASGGNASLLVDNSTVNFTGASIITSQNLAGNGATGGSAGPGNTSVIIRNGAVVNVADDPGFANDFLIGANSFGGNANGAGGNGGNAIGGTVSVALQGGTINLTGSMYAGAQGYGGTASLGGNGGNATGGLVTLLATGANSAINGTGSANFVADALGGYAASGAGGNATGGTVTLTAQGGTTLNVQTSLTASANATGGNGAAGGNATAGTVVARALSSGILNLLGATGLFSTDAKGGMGFSAAAGNAKGGTISILALGGGHLALNNNLFASSVGSGGDAGGSGADGGDGIGGTVELYAAGTNSSITAKSANLHADGIGGRGDGLECFSCNGNGGDGTGGDVLVGDGFYFDSLSANNSIDFNGILTMAANGTGGVGVGVSGNGSGGHAELSWYGTTTGSVTGNVSISSVGRGGDNFNGGAAGNGYGFGAIVGPDGGLTLGGNLYLDASGHGGSTFGIGGGTGGIGDGGVARLFNGLGTISIAGNHRALADGRGGDAYLGTGGDGIGGLAPLNAFDSEILIGGRAELSANGTGGDGNIGGEGTGGIARLLTSYGNGNIAIGGYASLDASGFGGDGIAGSGGGGLGGTAWLGADSGADLAVTSSLFLSADGFGGDGASGGLATGGLSYVRAKLDGSVAVGGVLFGSAYAFGGDGTSGSGGDAYGGTFSIYSTGDGSSATFSGNVDGTADAYGGNSKSGAGGYAEGGLAEIYTDDFGYALFANDLFLSVWGFGGDGMAGGAAVGGDAHLYSSTAGSLFVSGAADVLADAWGGDGSNGNGGNANGGEVRTYAANALLSVAGAVNLSTDGTGGTAGNSANSGGYGEGGATFLYANADGTIDLQSSLTASATGFGGDGPIGGNGQGGQVTIQASGANASVTAGSTELDASGYAVDGGGGSGTGGLVVVESFGAATASLNFLGNLAMYAGGGGGDGYDGSGGSGQGGEVRLTSTDGTVISVAGNAWLGTSATGGDTYDNASSGGNAVGGTSRIETFGTGGLGGTIAIAGNTDVTADGYGGGAHGAPSGQGGNGTGGSAQILTTLGTITIGTDGPGGSATVTADGYGGFAAGGTGGDGFGGDYATIEANGGDITIYGYATVSTSGFGGYGLTGGNGLGSGTPPSNTGSGVGGAHIFAKNGDIVIGGGAYVASAGSGGNGLNASGNGGNGTGGWATIHAANSNLGPSSITIIGDAFEGSGYAEVNVDGTGGNGGNGASGNVGGIGGQGGDGMAGTGNISAAAGNGTVTIDHAIGNARGTGGYGGNGGNGDGGAGGDGGDGGDGVGGSINIGTISGGNGEALSLNNGLGDYGTITADSSALGGRGGNGNGGATNGNGGDGGNATNGNAVLLVRGSTVNVDLATLTANATGGDAGFGYNNGSGPSGTIGLAGNATVGGDGGIGVVATNRYLLPAQRGTLNAGDINGTAIATAGIGIPNGSVSALGGNEFTFFNADGNINSLNFVVGVGNNAFGGSISGLDSVSIRNGNVDVINGFSFTTRSNLSLFANNGDMHAGDLTLSAGNFVFDPVNDPPSNRGTYFADTATITTGNNFVTSANLDIGGNLSINAPGLINAYNFTIGGNLDLAAWSGGITANILDVDGRADLYAAGSILLNTASVGFFHAEADGSFTSGDITSETDIQIDSGSNMTLGNLVAGLNVDPGSNQAIRLDSNGSILMGNAIAKDGIDFSATGSVTGGNLTSGISVGGDAGGAIQFGAISAGLISPQGVPDDNFSVGIGSETSITTGNVAGAYSVGFASLGPITTGTINAGADFLVMASGNMLFGPITAVGRVYLADSSMFIAAGGGCGDCDGDNFDPALVFGATPVPSLGSITINGPTLAGSFQAAAGTFFSSGAITTNGLLAINAGTSISVGAINAGTGAVSLIAGGQIGGSIAVAGSIYASSGGNLTLSNLTAGTSIFERSGGLITNGNLTAGSFIDIRSTGGIALGNLGAGNYIDLRSNGAIGLGNATSGQTINFQTLGTLTGLTITAGNSVLGQAVGTMQLGAITAGITAPSGVPGAGYRVGLASDGNITTSAINALGNIGFGTPLNLVTGNLTSGGGILALVGGNITAGSMTTGNSGYVYLGNYSMSPLGGPFLTFNRAPILALFPAATGGSIAINGPVTTGNFRASAGTAFNSGNINSQTNILVDSGGNMTLANLVAGLSVSDNDAIRLNSGGSIVLGNAIATDGIDFDAVGSVTGVNLTSGRSISGSAQGAISLGVLSAGFVTPSGPADDGFSVGMKSGTSISVGNVSGAESVGFATLGPITTGTINAGADFLVMASGNILTGAINAGGRVYLANSSMFTGNGGVFNGEDDFDPEVVFALTPVATGGSITAGAISASSVQASAGTTLNVGAIDADGLVALASGGAMQTQAISAGTSLRMASGGTINGGNLTAGTLVKLVAAGAVNVGNITISALSSAADTGGITTQDVATGTPVEVFGASIVTGNISTDGYVGLYTPGSLTVGMIDAGHDVIALAGTNASFGAITTPEQFILGGYAMFAGLNGGETFNPALAFSATKTRTGGSATFGGSSQADTFEAYVGTDTTLQSLQTSTGALIDTGGTFALNGTLNGNSRIISNDIDIGTNALVQNGDLHLISRNATQTLIGDGLTGSGYRLSDAEADRIHTQFTIAADQAYGAAPNMIIGDLTINAANGGDSESDYGFGTIAGSAENPSVGSIRIVGNVTFTGLGVGDTVGFDTRLFELDAATGSVSLYGQGTTLSGTLGIYAPNIFVASGDILAKLEANPRYSGQVAELNAPAAVQRPGGVLNAADFDIGGDNGDGGEDVLNFLVQNTGTRETPAGFLITDVGFDGNSDDGDAPPGSVNLVINGQIITQQGTLTGIAARDRLVTEIGTTEFTANSTINGCPLVGACSPPPPPVVDTVKPTDLQLAGNGGLGDGLFGNESDIDDGNTGDEGDLSSPIEPPMPLFDSRPLDQSDDINDPASGAGNPSLYGSPDEDDETDEEKKTKKVKKGDGK